MPYYPQQYGWGEALAQWGQTLSNWGRRKEDEAMNRLKNRYGNNVEAWRKDALKNPQGEEAKYYKKFVGDPSQNLPVDPMEQYKMDQLKWRENLANDFEKRGELDKAAYVRAGGNITQDLLRNGQPTDTEAQKAQFDQTKWFIENFPKAPPETIPAFPKVIREGKADLPDLTEGVSALLRGMFSQNPMDIFKGMEQVQNPPTYEAGMPNVIAAAGPSKAAIEAENKESIMEARELRLDLAKKSADRADKLAEARLKEIEAHTNLLKKQRERVVKSGDKDTNLSIKAFDNDFDFKSKQMYQDWQDKEKNVKEIAATLRKIDTFGDPNEVKRQQDALSAQLASAEQAAADAKQRYMSLSYVTEYNTWRNQGRAQAPATPSPAPAQGPPSLPVTSAAPPVKKHLGL